MKINKRSFVWIFTGIAFTAVCTLALAPKIYKSKFDGSGEETAVQTSAAVSEGKDRLKEFLLEQEQLRSMQISELEEIINSEESSRELVDSAQTQKMEVLKKLETEKTIAGILQTRGYTDAVVTAGAESINVLISSLQAEEDDIARIRELIISQTDIGAENIKIIPIN